MKKILCLVAMAVMLFSSCLKNEEPASLTQLREAKSALITAQAAYKTAEAALKQAEVEFQNALTAEQVLLNEMQALLNEAQEIENEMKALELEIQQAETEAEKAHYEALKAEYENDLLENQQERERMLAEHQRDMFDLLEQVAQAELDYENALKLMEASKLNLSPEQQAVVDNYVAALSALRYGGSYENAAGQTIIVTESLTDLRQDLIDYSAQLKNAEFNWNHEERIAQAMLDSVIAKAAYDEEIAAMERFAKFAEDINIQEWVAEAAELEDSIKVVMNGYTQETHKFEDMLADVEAIGDALDEIDAKAEYIANNPDIATPDDAPDPDENNPIVKSEKYVLEQERDALKDVLDETMEALEEVPSDLEIEVPEKLQHVFIRDVIIANNFHYYDIDIEKNPETGLYYLENGKIIVEDVPLFSYDEYTPAVNEEDLIDDYRDLKDYTKALILDVNTMVTKSEELATRKGDYGTGLNKAYNTARSYWNTVLPKVTTGVAAYKIGQEYDAQDALIDAHEAYVELVDDLAAATPPATPTEAQKQAYLDNYVKYLNLREPLDGVVKKIVVDGKEVRLADNLKAADWGTKFLDTDLEEVRNAAILTMDSGTIPAGMDYMHEDYAKQGVLPMWRDLSTVLWGKAKLRVSVDDVLGEDFHVIVDEYSNVWIADLGDVKLNLTALGYSMLGDEQFEVNEFSSSLWWDYIEETAIIQNLEATINNQTEIVEMVAYFDEKIAEYEGEFADLEAMIEDYEAADKEMEEAIEAVIEKYHKFIEENKAPLLAEKDLLAEEIFEQQIIIAKIDAQKEALNDLRERYMLLINDYYEAVTGDNPSATDLDALEEAIKTILLTYEQDIIDLSETLNEELETLLALRNGTDEDSVLYEQTLERLTDKVNEIEKKIEDRIAMIEFYEDLLKDTLEVFAGGEEVEEGGEEA